MANRDSETSQTIAIESASIAEGARQDSHAMKTIAALTMFFLPATFISSFLGTNLFVLNTSGNGKPELIVSELWWIYLVSAVPLTLFTLLVWWLYLQWLLRGRRIRIARQPCMVAVRLSKCRTWILPKVWSDVVRQVNENKT